MVSATSCRTRRSLKAEERVRSRCQTRAYGESLNKKNHNVGKFTVRSDETANVKGSS